MIYKYRKIIEKFESGDSTTHKAAGEYTELCTLDGETYIHTEDLPEQPEQITIKPIDLTDDLKAQIKDTSPHVRLIRARVVEKIREKYSANDEMKIVSLYFTNPTDPRIQECSDYKESCRIWGRVEKEKLGL